MKKTAQTLMLLAILCCLYVFPVMAANEIPEAAKEKFQAGVASIEKANKPADFMRAVSEFDAAAALAPQWPDIHYNLAKLSAEIDKPAKAIKEYRTYLTLVPSAPDRAAVEGEIVKLQGQLARKKKIGLPGVTFAAMPDGIWVMQLYPGSRVGNTGLRRGSKIVAIEGKSVVGATLDEFFKAIEAGTADSDTMKSSTKERLFSRNIGYVRSTKMVGGDNRVQESGPVLALSIISPGMQQPGTLFFKKSMFRSNVVEIEGDEFETEVLRSDLPVVVTFWAGFCEPCRQFVPVVEAESTRYAGKIKFVNINAEENGNLLQQLQIKGVPTLMVYKGGVKVSSDTGKLSKEKVEEIFKSAAGQ